MNVEDLNPVVMALRPAIGLPVAEAAVGVDVAVAVSVVVSAAAAAAVCGADPYAYAGSEA